MYNLVSEGKYIPGCKQPTVLYYALPVSWGSALAYKLRTAYD